MGDHEDDAVMNLDLNLGPMSPSSVRVEPGSSGPSSAVGNGELGLDEQFTELIDRRIRETLQSSWGRQLTRAYPRLTRRLDLGQLQPDPIDEALLPDQPEIGNGISGRFSFREMLRSSSTRWRQRHAREEDPLEALVIPDSEDNEDRDVVVDGGSMLHIGEGSGSGEERNNHDIEDNIVDPTLVVPEGGAADKKDSPNEKGIGTDGGFFDCNICLDLARDPIVTCCGHLFCWPCIYRWLHIHSDAKECPVCKGEVTAKNVTPIYGRGNNTTREVDEDVGSKIPLRPIARRVESLRQAIQRTAASFPIEEMIRRLGSRFDLTRADALQPTDIQGAAQDTIERGQSLLNRILTSRGMRREQNLDVGPDNVVHVREDAVTRPEVSEYRRLPSLIYRRAHSQFGVSAPVHPISLGERYGEAINRAPPVAPVRSQDHPPSVDDRDSFSSIAAVIHGESQNVDTAVEIDSGISLSTSSSRRRSDASRVSDMDSGDSRVLRRRRLN